MVYFDITQNQKSGKIKLYNNKYLIIINFILKTLSVFYIVFFLALVDFDI